MEFHEHVYQVALNMLPGIGPVTAKKLVSHCGSAGEVFRQKKKALLKIPNVGPVIAASLKNDLVFGKAEKEIHFAEENNIRLIFYLDAAYPKRLRACYDSPVLLYYKGTVSLDHPKIVGIIGTRRATDYGEALTEKLVEELAPLNPVIISGLAYGIDIIAHRAALKNNLPSIGVLAHGLDLLYPYAHKPTAKKMTEQGGLLGDFPSGTKPDKENFPLRNRIVAGLCDALVVVESGESGGSMITAEFANNYNRDVFAFPGRTGDVLSAGCHKLIKTHKAALIESGADLISFMSWETKNKEARQEKLLLALSEEEEAIVNAMRGQGNVHVDELCAGTGFPSGKVAALLLQLEFNGVVKALPGKFYRLN
jgi:DNA processing protein